MPGEAQFGCVPGVLRTRVGFSGGSTPNPTYRTIGDHTETVDIEYDPSVTSYSAMLDMFWKNHDPTSSCSRQYMSAIFYNSEEQKELAEASFQKAKAEMKKDVQTVVTKATEFYNAEDYHQKYILQKHQELMELLNLKRGPGLIESSVAARLNGYIGLYGTKEAFEAEVDTLGLSEEAVEYVLENFKYGKGGGC